jgi:hypothetical protein
MRKIHVLGVLALICLVTTQPTVLGQRFSRPGVSRGSRGYGGYGGYGDDAGVLALQSSAVSQANARNIAQSNRLMGQNAAAQQRAMIQSGIRNTLSTQANERTQYILGQQQSNRDWWFQTQQQQMAGRPASGGSVPAMVACGYDAEAGAAGLAVADAAPKAAMDIIKWPIVLQEKEFASRRAKIEAPYRRSPPASKVPTAEDYRAMVKDVDEMKAILEWRLTVMSGLDSKGYEQAKDFLNKLGAEASERSVAAVHAPKSE